MDFTKSMPLFYFIPPVVLPHPTDLLQFFFIYKLDLTTVDGDNMFRHEGGQGADGIRSRHIRKICQIFTRQINTQRRTVFFQSITVFEEQKRFCQTSADMLLRQVDRPFIGDTQIGRQLTDKEHRQIRIGIDQLLYHCHRDQANGRRFECGSIGQIILLCEISPITEILYRLDHTDNLATATYTVFEYFHLSFQQTHHVLRFVTFAINQFIPFEGLN